MLLDSGERLVEQVSLPQVRARGVAEALIGIGVSPDIIDVKWSDYPVAGTGVEDFRKRRTEIAVTIKAPRKARR